MAEPRPNHAQRCEKVLALDHAVQALERAREELAACLWAESEAVINFWIDQLRTARAIFEWRLIEYKNHYEDCVACQPDIERHPAGDLDAPPGHS